MTGSGGPRRRREGPRRPARWRSPECPRSHCQSRRTSTHGRRCGGTPGRRSAFRPGSPFRQE
eukprot:6740959-Prymnesium_polylepis.7